jgi:hypothetical protein
MEHPGFFLRPGNNPSRSMVESLEHAQRRLAPASTRVCL